MQSYFMYAGHRYDIIKRGFPSYAAAEEYNLKSQYRGQAQPKKLADGRWVLGWHRTYAPKLRRRR